MDMHTDFATLRGETLTSSDEPTVDVVRITHSVECDGGSLFVQETLPDIEWRGRSRRLGNTPFYLSYDSSLAWIRQNDLQFRTATYCSDPLDSTTCERRTETFPLVADQ